MRRIGKKKKSVVSQFTKNCGWEKIRIKAIFFSGTCEMLKARVEAGTNLLCQALVRAELHPLTVWRRKSLFMLVHQGFQASVRKHRSFTSLRELILHTELPDWSTVPPSTFTSVGKIREISLFSTVETFTRL